MALSVGCKVIVFDIDTSDRIFLIQPKMKLEKNKSFTDTILFYPRKEILLVGCRYLQVLEAVMSRIFKCRLFRMLN
jgi:hypothetical protein